MNKKPDQWYADALDRKRRTASLIISIYGWAKILLWLMIIAALIKYIV